MAEPIFERVRRDLARYAHHHELPSLPATPSPERNTIMSIATELEAKIDEVAENVSGWFDDLKAKAAPVITKADQYESKIEADPFIGSYLEANFAVPEHLVSLALDFLQKLVSTTAGQAPAQQPAA
jgi:hypothetical protein